MPLNYAIYPNKVSKEKAYRALVKNRKNHSLEDVLDRMERHRSTIARFEAHASIMLFISVIEEILEDGGSVSTPLFNAMCSISGKFRNEEDRFHSSRHEVKVHLKPGERLRALAKSIKTRKVKAAAPAPFVEELHDMSSGSFNAMITPGGPAIIKGGYLSFDAGDPDQGIYFLGDNDLEHKVETIHRNVFSQLVILVPKDLPIGQYRLQVRSSLKTKNIRTGELHKKLTVDQP
jgi:hypothetical protein